MKITPFFRRSKYNNAIEWTLSIDFLTKKKLYFNISIGRDLKIIYPENKVNK